MDKITLVVPCYNEQEVLPAFYEETARVLDGMADIVFSYLFVDDGSSDDTPAVLEAFATKDARVSYIRFTRNFGKEAAMMAGLDYADGDAVVLMDADLQHPPALIPEMISWWRKGYDDVCGKRTDRAGETWLKRTMANLFYRISCAVSRYEVQRDVGDFRLLDRRCVAALRLMRENQRFTKGMFTWIGFHKKEIPFTVQPRAGGETTWSYFALANLALEGITSFTTAPLRLTTIFGLFVSALAIFYMLFVLVNATLYGDPVAGYPTLMTVLLFLGGVQLLSLGIIGEYLGRVFTESKRRPAYLIDRMDGKRMIYDAPVLHVADDATKSVEKA
mgnify:CR=1 FL=1